MHHDHYRRTGPVPVQRPKRRMRRRLIAVFAVVIGVQAGWIGTVALAQNAAPEPVAPGTSAAETMTSSGPAVATTAAPTGSTTPSTTGSPVPTTTVSATPRATEATRGPQEELSSPVAPARTATSLFSADSPWNTPIGSGAAYAASGDLVRDAGSATINSTVWSVPVAIAASGDPTTRVRVDSGTTATHRMPADATPSADSDGELAVIDGTHSYEYWGLSGGAGSGWSARYGAVVDLTGAGTTGGVRASGFSLLGGLIRPAETTGGIDHALVVALAADQLHTGPIAPATSQDGDAASSYSGDIHMGQLVAIPRSVDLDALHLSPAGMRLARALQTYGAYVGDRSAHLTLYAQPEAEGPQLAAMRTALRSELVPLLRLVSSD